jgi:hypothetical protein
MNLDSLLIKNVDTMEDKIQPDVWIEEMEDGTTTAATGIESVMPNGEKLQQVSKEKFALIRNSPEDCIYRGFGERTIGMVLYNLWDNNVEVPNETNHVQYNKGYMHALADVKRILLGGDNFPGDLENQSLSKQNEQSGESS